MTYSYEGTLDTYFETGMECLSLVLVDNRGKKPNPVYDPAKTGWPFDLKEYFDVCWTIFLSKGDHLTVYKEDGSVLWSGILKTDRTAMAESNYCFSFLPEGVDHREWLSWFKRELRAKVVSTKKRHHEENNNTTGNP